MAKRPDERLTGTGRTQVARGGWAGKEGEPRKWVNRWGIEQGEEYIECDEAIGRPFMTVLTARQGRRFIDAETRALGAIIGYGDKLGKLLSAVSRKYGISEGARREIRGTLRQLMNGPELSLTRKSYPAGCDSPGAKPIDMRAEHTRSKNPEWDEVDSPAEMLRIVRRHRGDLFVKVALYTDDHPWLKISKVEVVDELTGAVRAGSTQSFAWDDSWGGGYLMPTER